MVISERNYILIKNRKEWKSEKKHGNPSQMGLLRWPLFAPRVIWKGKSDGLADFDL